MLIEDIRVDLGIRIGVDILFDLDGPPYPYNPREGDYYIIVDGVATLIRVRGSSEISDDTGGLVSDDSGGGISDSSPAGTVYLTDTNGNIMYDGNGNPMIII